MFRYDYRYTKYVVLGLVATAIGFKHNWVYKTLLAIAAWATVYYAGLTTYFFAIGVVALTDVVTGTWASLSKGQRFSSKRLGRGVIQKTVVYFLIIQASFEIGKVLQSAVKHETFWLSWILTLLILLYELSSIIENAIVINPDMVFLNRFKNIFEKIVDRQEQNVADVLGAAGEEKSGAVEIIEETADNPEGTA